MKKKLAIVFGITTDYDFALANVLLGLTKHNKIFWDDIIIFHDGVSLNIQKKINSITKCKFIDYRKLSQKLVVNEKVKKDYSLLSFSRFECFNFLKEYENVMWQDVDILIQGNIEGLLDYAQKTGYAATIADSNFLIESNFNKLLNIYNMYSPLVNAGILCLSDKLNNYEKMTDWCYEKTNEYGDIIRFADQGILNILIQEFNIDIEEIDILKYCCHPLKPEVVESSIVHAYGSDKFWNSSNYKEMFPEWVQNNQKWESIKFKDIKIKHNNSKKIPLVSVIMSIYERTEFLNEAIDSILNQTYTNFELIIVIEYSKYMNNIEKLIKKYSDNRIKIIKNNKKEGFAASLNIAIDESKGNYIIRMDDDDISLPKRIETQVDYMERNINIDVMGSAMKLFGRHNDVLYLPNDDLDIKVMLLFKNPFFHPTVILRKSSIDKYNYRYDPNYYTEDYEFWSRISENFTFANINDVLLHYRAYGQNATVNNNIKVTNSVIRVMKNNFSKYLKIDFSDNEIQLLFGGKDLLSKIYNLDEAKKTLNVSLERIIDQNNKYNVYNNSILLSYINDNYNYIPYIEQQKSILNFKQLIKRVVYKILYPIYIRFMNRVERLIDTKINNNNYILNMKITSLEKEIKQTENVRK